VHACAAPPLYVPGLHNEAVALVDPVEHECPAAHGPSHVDAVAPGPAPYRPASQGPLQAEVDSPAVAPNAPGGHSVQAPAPLTLYVPGLHRTATALVLLAGQAYPAVHSPLQAAVGNPAVAP
jgi:hypothetical protein